MRICAPIPTLFFRHQSLSAGAIAGIVIGAVASIALAIFLFFRILRSRSGNAPIIEPFPQRTGPEMTSALQAHEASQLYTDDPPPLVTVPVVKKVTPPAEQRHMNIDAIRDAAAGSSTGDNSNTVTVSGHRSNVSTSRTSPHLRPLPMNPVPEDVPEEAPRSVITQSIRNTESRPISQPRQGGAVSSSVTSMGRSSHSARSMERLADAVANRLVQRFGDSSHNEDVSPPSYSLHESQ